MMYVILSEFCPNPQHQHALHQGLDSAPDSRTSWQEPITLGAATLPPGVFTLMGMRDERLSQATSERLAQVPSRLGHLCEGWRRLVELCFQLVEPLVKTRMELPAQGVPLFACTDLLERDHLSRSHGGLLVWQDEVTFSCSL
jgi:hypothetical protein